MIQALQDETTQGYCSARKIQWMTIAECAPWWGGFYERLIRSPKTSMWKIIGKAAVPLEELRTIVTEVEGTLNNRPLTYVHAEPDERLPITPADVIG